MQETISQRYGLSENIRYLLAELEAWTDELQYNVLVDIIIPSLLHEDRRWLSR